MIGEGRLPLKDFKKLVKDSALCVIDLIVKNRKGAALLGLRKNRPARGSWFVPGGRVFKNENLKDALRRISKDELGTEFTVKDVRFLGIYEHFYKETFFDDTSGTHFIVIACELKSRNRKLSLPYIQHNSYKFMDVGEIIKSRGVHRYTKNYFVDSPENLFFRCG